MNGCPGGEILSAYLDGELTSARGKELRAHLDGCASCSKALEEFRVVTDGVRAAYQRQPLEGEWHAVWKRLRKEPGVAAPQARGGSVWQVGARLAFLAAAAAIVAAIVLWPRRIDETPPTNLAMTANGTTPVEEVQVFDGSTVVVLDYPDDGVSLVWFVSPQAPPGEKTM